MEQSFTHGIDLSRVTHRHGQSPDLEPKRQRAWNRLEERERQYVVNVYNKPVTDWDLPFSEVNSAYERMLYVLVTTDRALSAEQIIYMMIARHYRNADITSIRKQLAIGVRQEHLRLVGHNRYGSTDEADEKLRLVEQQWRARRDAGRIARVVRAAQAAGIESPDLSLGPIVPDVPETPEMQGVAGEPTSENSAELSAAYVASMEERFPGMTGGFEGDAGDDPVSDATVGPESDSPSDVAEGASLEERFPGMTGEFEGEADGEPEGEPDAEPASEADGEPAGDSDDEPDGDSDDGTQRVAGISDDNDEDDQSPSED